MAVDAKESELTLGATESELTGGPNSAFLVVKPSRHQYTNHAFGALAVSGFLSLGLIIFIHCDLAYDTGNVFTNDSHHLSVAFSHLAAIPFATAMTNWLTQTILVKAPFFKVKDFTVWPPMLSRHLMSIITLFCIGQSLNKVLVKEHTQWIMWLHCQITAWVACHIGFKWIDTISDHVEDLVKVEQVSYSSKPLEKMRSIMSSVGVTHHGKPEKDVVYSYAVAAPGEFTGGATFHLLYMWLIFAFLLKCGISVATILFLLGLEATAQGLILAVGLSTVIGSFMAILKLQPAITILLELAIYRPYYIGDIIEISSLGNASKINECTGFVEAFTLGGIVLRNFSQKQTWIPYSVLGDKVVQNWTRRPTKTVLLSVQVSSACPVALVQELCKFGKEWIKASPEILQSSYKKCVVTKVESGFHFEIIFFPAIGVSHKEIRQKFLLHFMEAAERLQVPMVPADIAFAFPTDGTRANLPLDKMDFSDLMPKPSEKGSA